MTTRKSARNRRSAEQMLIELKRRLREISDLNAAGDIAGHIFGHNGGVSLFVAYAKSP